MGYFSSGVLLAALAIKIIPEKFVEPWNSVGKGGAAFGYIIGAVLMAGMVALTHNDSRNPVKYKTKETTLTPTGAKTVPTRQWSLSLSPYSWTASSLGLRLTRRAREWL